MLRTSLLILLLSTVILLLSGLTSCKDTQTGPGSEITFPDSNISYSKQVGPLLAQKCTSGCHNGDTTSNNPSGLNLFYPESYSMMINRGLVIPRDGSHSPLIYRLEGVFPLMPPTGKLNDNQITGVKKWIDEGAQNN